MKIIYCLITGKKTPQPCCRLTVINNLQIIDYQNSTNVYTSGGMQIIKIFLKKCRVL